MHKSKYDYLGSIHTLGITSIQQCLEESEVKEREIDLADCLALRTKAKAKAKGGRFNNRSFKCKLTTTTWVSPH